MELTITLNNGAENILVIQMPPSFLYYILLAAAYPHVGYISGLISRRIIRRLIGDRDGVPDIIRRFDIWTELSLIFAKWLFYCFHVVYGFGCLFLLTFTFNLSVEDIVMSLCRSIVIAMRGFRVVFIELSRMSIFNILILIYWPHRLMDAVVLDRHLRGWYHELLDFACYSVQMIILHIFWMQNPQFSSMDVLALSYPFSRLLNILILERQMFHWKAELKALLNNWITLFLIEIFLRLIRDEFEYRADLYWWLIFFVCTWPTMKLFDQLPLDDFGNEDDEI